MWRRLWYTARRRIAAPMPWVVVLPIAIGGSVLLVIFAAPKTAGAETLFTLNALGATCCVLLVAHTRLLLGPSDLPQLEALSVVPCGDRRWLAEFIKGRAPAMLLSLAFSATTLLFARRLPQTVPLQPWPNFLLAVGLQTLLIGATALFLSSVTPTLVRSRWFASGFRAAGFALLAAVLMMLYRPAGAVVVQVVWPWLIPLLPPAWPAGVLWLEMEGLDLLPLAAWLALCGIVAMVVGLWAFKRFAADFKIAEVSYDPCGVAYALRPFGLAYLRELRDRPLSRVPPGRGEIAERSEAHGDTASEAEALHDPTTAPLPRLGEFYERFWERHGRIAHWFSADEKNVIALSQLASGSPSTLRAYFFSHLTRLLLLAAVVLLASPLLGERRLYLLALGAAIIVFWHFSGLETASALAHRNLPLSTTQWIWPRVKYQWLRSSLVLLPALALLLPMFWFSDAPADEIAKVAFNVVVTVYLIPPLGLMVSYGEGGRHPWWHVTVALTMPQILASLLLIGAGAIAMWGLPWPTSLGGIAMAIAATCWLWKTLCRWYERGPVDLATGHRPAARL